MSKRRRDTNQTVEPTLFAEDAPKGETRMMYSLPPRFHAVANMEGGFVTLTDSESRQDVKIVPAAFGEVRRVLGAFFGGHPEEETDFTPDLETSKSRQGEPREAVQAPVSAQRAEADRPPVSAQAPAQESRAAAAAEAPPAAKVPAKRGRPAADKASSPPAVAEQAPASAKAPENPPVKAPEVAAAAAPQQAPASTKASKGKAAEAELPEGWERRYKEDGYTLEFTPHAKDEWPGYRIVVGGEVQGHVWREIQQPIRKPEGREPKIRFMVSYKGDDEVSVHRNMMGVQSRLGVKFGPNND